MPSTEPVPPELRVVVDKDLPTPAYLQLKEQLSLAIDDGTMPAGSALPSERGLADSLGLSRMTVRRAFEQLVSEGLIEQRQGSGTYVRGRPLEQYIDRVLGFADEARSLGFEAGTRLLQAKTLPADEHLAAQLGARAGEPVLRLVRLRTADGEPLALQEAHLHPDLHDLDMSRLRSLGSLYHTLEAQYRLRPVRARQTIGARLPTNHESSVLGIGREVPILSLERTTFDSDDRAFEYTRSAYRGDIYRLALDLRAV